MRQRLSDDRAHRDQSVEVDAGVAAHRLEEEDGVLHDDVTGRARRVRAAAKPAERSVELVAAGVIGGEHIGEAQAPRIVEMRRHRQRRHIGDDLPEHALDRRRLAIADRVGEDDAVGPGFGDLIGDAPHPILVDVALDGAAERGSETAIDLRRLVARMAKLNDTAEILDQLLGRPAHVGEVVAIADRQHVVHLGHAQRHAALGAARIGDQR